MVYTLTQTYSGRPVWITLHLGEDQIARFPILIHAERIAELERDEDEDAVKLNTHLNMFAMRSIESLLGCIYSSM